MVRRIVEGVQLIRIGKNTALTPTQIQYSLNKAYGSRTYAKFYTDKVFIQVNFMRDGTINVASNIRLPQFVQDLWKRNKQGWTMPVAKSFVYQWMSVSRRLLY